LIKHEVPVDISPKSCSQASLEADAVPRREAFNWRSELIIEVSATERNVPPDEGKQEDLKDDEEVNVLKPSPRNIEAVAAATQQQERTPKRGGQKRHRSGYRHRNYQLSSTTRKQVKGNRKTWRRRGDDLVKAGKSPRKANVRQFDWQRKRNKAVRKSARVASSHGVTKSKLSRVDESEELGCLPMAFSCLWMFRMLFQCMFRQNQRD
jgi:hypothetical protein